MSLNQCTPETSLPTVMNAVKTMMAKQIRRLIAPRFMRDLNCIIAVGITHSVSIVVDDG